MQKITDTYKAAYFMTQGASLVDVEIKHERELLRNYTWVCVLDGVTDAMKGAWDTRNAVVNLDDLIRERNRIKKLVQKKR